MITLFNKFKTDPRIDQRKGKMKEEETRMKRKDFKKKNNSPSGNLH